MPRIHWVARGTGIELEYLKIETRLIDEKFASVYDKARAATREK